MFFAGTFCKIYVPSLDFLNILQIQLLELGHCLFDLILCFNKLKHFMTVISENAFFLILIKIRFINVSLLYMYSRLNGKEVFLC